MIVLLSEISKCLNKKLQIDTVSESLTMIGLEVESINEVSLSSLDSNIVVGNIKKIVKHPNADKLFVVEIKDGPDSTRTVCAGLKGHYTASQLEGLDVVFGAILKPRKL